MKKSVNNLLKKITPQPHPEPGKQKQQRADQNDRGPGRRVQVEGKEDARKASRPSADHGDPEEVPHAPRQVVAGPQPPGSIETSNYPSF